MLDFAALFFNIAFVSKLRNWFSFRSVYFWPFTRAHDLKIQL